MITKKKRLLFLNFLFILFYLSAVSYIIADNSSSGRELFFGPSILGLEGTGLIASKSKEGSVPLNKTSLTGGKQETLHFNLDMSQASLKTIKSKDYVKIDGLKPYGSPGEPQLPFKSFVVPLPLNSTVSGVNVSNVSYRPIFNKLDIVTNPIPVARASKMLKGNQIINTEKQTSDVQEGSEKTQKRYASCKKCNLESFFPGDLISYHIGKTNNNQIVFIKFFPMQYIPGTGRAMLITNADITVNYQVTDSKQKTE